MAAALAARAKSSLHLIFRPLISHRLHICQPVSPVSQCTGHMPISTQGFTTNSVLSLHTKPGSPNSLTLSMSLRNCLRVVFSRNNNAELFERARWGFSANQLPVLAVAISISSAENRQMVAERRTPPDNTASEA